METWQVWLISISSIILAATFITLLVYLVLALRSLRKSLNGALEQIDACKPVIDFFSGVKSADKQVQRDFSEESLHHTPSYEIGKLVTEMAVSGIALWKTVQSNRRSS